MTQLAPNLLEADSMGFPDQDRLLTAKSAILLNKRERTSRESRVKTAFGWMI